ncbi:hypothetical protein [Kitasatospora sp. NBC_01300]|uniref:hypothetical protein n=1 Tax=Kitasatospora sp. NBC_01300 TaxID=2903574 RepID=UPI002F90E1FB|nr:hypothetical protein OG556_40710 [Kitasatospora sp. NBC_01300]
MDLPPTLLPSLSFGCPAVLAVAATAYLPAGACYLALTGTDTAWLRRLHLPAPAVLLAAAASWLALALLWPLLLTVRAATALRRRRREADLPLRIQPLAVVPATRTPDALPAAVIPPKPTAPPVPPRWYTESYAAIHAALADGRTAIARTWAGYLADDATIEFGPAHPYTQEAWLLVARTVRTALADIGSAPATIDAQPIGDPYYFLSPQAHQVQAWNPDRDGVYVEVAR